jgi:DNA-binding response OmpR family regulator
MLDGDPGLRSLVTPIGEGHGYRIDVGPVGYEAIFAARRPRPQLLLLGFTLGEGESIELLRELHAVLPKAPIALMTHESPEDVAVLGVWPAAPQRSTTD